MIFLVLIAKEKKNAIFIARCLSPPSPPPTIATSACQNAPVSFFVASNFFTPNLFVSWRNRRKEKKKDFVDYVMKIAADSSLVSHMACGWAGGGGGLKSQL